MAEREGTREDFLHLLGRGPEPEQEAEQPDKPPAETEPEVDPLIAALTQPKSWGADFVRAMHPPDEDKG